jgi:hypothetical protein
VLLHKLKSASNSSIVIFSASHSNLSYDPSCILKDRGTNEGAIFDINSGIEPPQPLAPVEEDLGFRNLLAILHIVAKIPSFYGGKGFGSSVPPLYICHSSQLYNCS